MDKLAIVTVSDMQFCIGTKVLLFSIFKHNKWFKGDIIVYEDNITDKEKEEFDIFPNVYFENIGTRLSENIKSLCATHQYFTKKYRRFFSIQTFNLPQYDKVLFLDSDILCQGSLKCLFETENYFLSAALDNQFYAGKKREIYSFRPVNSNSIENQLTLDSFNTGVFLINNKLLPVATYDSILNFFQPKNFRFLKTHHTDQYILNRFFYNRVNFLPPTYNLLLKSAAEINLQYGLKVEDSILLHFLGVNKPWTGNIENNTTIAKHAYDLWWAEHNRYHAQT